MAKRKNTGGGQYAASNYGAGSSKTAGGTQQGQYGVPGEQTPPPPPPPDGGAGAGAGGGRPSGTPIRDLFNQMGGKKGAGMDFKKFKDWYKNQSEQVGGDLGSFLASSPDLDPQRLQGADYGVGASFTAGSDIEDFLQPSYLSDEGELQVLNERMGSDFGSLEAAMESYALGSGMAGVEQFRRNVSGEGGANLPDWLQNVSAQDIRYNPESWELFYNAMMESSDPAARAAKMQELVQPWMTDVDKALQGQVDINREGQTGIPFGFELMMDPNINLGGGGEPLWSGAAPGALTSLTGFQEGETAFAKGLSMEELMRDIWPILQAQTHQPAGAAAPFEAGLSFGSPVWDETRGQYQRSPLMGYGDEYAIDPDLARLEGFAGRSATETELAGPGGLAGGLYNRWSAHGMPGTSDYDPSYAATLMGGNPSFTMSDFGWQEGDPRIQQMVDAQNQNYWSNPIYEPWQKLPEDVRRRFQALINAPLGPGGASTLTEGYG